MALILASRSDGSVNQATSRTAIAAVAAAEMLGIRGEDQADWFHETLLVGVGKRGRKDALSLRKARSPWDETRGRKAEGDRQTTATDDWLWDGIEIDPGKLDLQQALAVFAKVESPALLVGKLESTVGVIRVYRGYGDSSGALVIAHIIFLGANRRAELDEALAKTNMPFDWVELHSVLPNRPFAEKPGAATWVALTQQLARLEGLDG